MFSFLMFGYSSNIRIAKIIAKNDDVAWELTESSHEAVKLAFVRSNKT